MSPSTDFPPEFEEGLFELLDFVEVLLGFSFCYLQSCMFTISTEL
jgi:hypothetical protein